MRKNIPSPKPNRLAPLAAGLLLSLLGAAAGCSSGASDLPPLAEVSGTVTLDGQPLEGAQVIFQPETGVSSVGKTDEQGRFTLAYNQDNQGAVLGKHTVRITKYGEPGSPNDTENQLPEKYNQNSPLTAEVKKDENSFNFPLEGRP